MPTIIANEIKDFGEQKQNIFVIDITDLAETPKTKLRGAIKYFGGDKNNINVYVKINEDKKLCGQIYLNKDILEIFEDIVGKERCMLEK